MLIFFEGASRSPENCLPDPSLITTDLTRSTCLATLTWDILDEPT